MRKNKIGVGIIGLGAISPSHERGYAQVPDLAEVVAVCDADAALAARRAAPHGARAYARYQELLDDPRVEAVDIILPHHLHYPVALDALARRKHVIVEKPLALTSAQALELCERASAEGVKLTVAENTRFVAAYVEAEKMIRGGALGEARLLRTFISGSEVHRLKVLNNWRGKKAASGGGVIADAGPHSFYLLKWLVGEIADVQVFESRLVEESQVEDNAVVAGHFKNGALFVTEYSFTVEAPWNERLEFHGSRGTLIIDQLCNPPARYHFGGDDYAGQALPGVPFDPTGWKQQSIAAGIADFVRAIWDDRQPAVDPLDGCYAVRIVERAYEAVTSGHPVPV